MNGPEALRYVLRRLALEGLNDPELDDPELYDYITEGRDHMLLELALCSFPGSITEQELEEVSPATAPHTYKIPDASPSAIRVFELMETNTFSTLEPMATHDDLGEYRWLTRKIVQLASGLNPEGGLTLRYMAEGVGITQDTLDTDAAWGIPTFSHRSACKYAAYLALTANEETDGKNAEKQFYRELDRIQRIAGEFDAVGGLAFRKAFLAGEGQRSADSIY